MTSNKLENLLHLVGWFSWKNANKLYRFDLVSYPRTCRDVIQDSAELRTGEYSRYWSYSIVTAGMTQW